MPSISDDPATGTGTGPGGLETGLRAARLRRGLSQEQAATLVNASLSSFRRWDRGGSPQDPGMAQAIAEALQTPIEVIWPPEDNPAAATALRAIRDQRAKDEAREAAKVHDLEAHQQREATLAQTAADAEEADDVWTAPAAASAPAPSRRVPNPLDLVATLDGKDDVAPGAARPGRRRQRLLVPAAVGVIAIAAAGTAIATTDGDDQSDRSVAQVAQTGSTSAERERIAQRSALAEATDRGDYDQAIVLATRLNDSAATTRLREAAGNTLARRARSAAERGDLDLAAARLEKAKKRYGSLPAIDVVRRRIEAIAKARINRAAQRKRAARKRAAERARAAAAARRSAPSQNTTPPSSSASPPAPSTPSPSSPAPSTPAPSSPAPNSGSGSGSSGGSSSGETVDPGIF